jgi:hypothetical protein
MAKLTEIIYNIANMRKNFSRSDDDMPDRQIAFIIDYYRAYLIEQEANKGKLMSSGLIQDLGRVRLIRADKHQECTIKNCILRTEERIPDSLDTNTSDLITFVGTMSGSKSFQRTTYNRALLDKHAKYTGKDSKWYKSDGYIYIINPPNNMLKYVNIQGIFEDPTEAYKFRTLACPDNDEADCWKGFDYEYPLPTSMLPSLYSLIRDNEMKFASILQEDTTNDSIDN